MNDQTWVNFAMERGVKELELNLSLYAYEPLIRPVYLDPFGRYAQSSSAKGVLSLSLTALRISNYFLISILSNLPNLVRHTMRNCCFEVESIVIVVDPSLKLRWMRCHIAMV